MPPQGRRRHATEQHRDPHRGGAQRPLAGGHLAGPLPAQQRHGLVENLASPTEIDAGRGEIVGAPARTQTHREPATGNIREAAEPFGQQCRRVGRRQQDVRHQADPLRGARGDRQAHDRVLTGIHDPVDRGQVGETTLLGAARPLTDDRPGRVSDVVRQTHADSHHVVLSVPRGWSSDSPLLSREHSNLWRDSRLRRAGSQYNRNITIACVLFSA
ncbi:hypothetical protein C1Y40_01437 [Mycobacterium talmoniae]|uniref:Uncharacterized protein n=1 Tax=Mycobacterium talmoniae TaxID=1858794 RepID=A0A2S8BNU1_9MYCO|nr:hypothetical protein C1Y40_01437 [Mycobacterium talmoniae]